MKRFSKETLNLIYLKNCKYRFSILFIFFCVAFYIFGASSIIYTSALYQTVTGYLIHTIAYLTTILIRLFGFNVNLFLESNTLIYGNEIINISNRLGVKFYILLFFILILFPNNIKKSLYLYVIGMFSLIFLTTIRISGEILLTDIWSFWLTNLVFYLRWILIISFIAIRANDFPWLINSFNKISDRTKENLSPPLFLLILISPILISIHRVIDMSFYIFDYDFLLNTILLLSGYFMEMLGYPDTIIKFGNCIYLENNYVCVGAPCLGVGIMISFTFLIVIIRSFWINKIIYIFIGLFVMTLMNSFRIVYLLIHLYKNQSYQLAMDVHDLSNYFFYIITFSLILIYILWFQNLNLYKK